MVYNFFIFIIYLITMKASEIVQRLVEIQAELDKTKDLIKEQTILKNAIKENGIKVSEEVSYNWDVYSVQSSMSESFELDTEVIEKMTAKEKTGFTEYMEFGKKFLKKCEEDESLFKYLKTKKTQRFSVLKKKNAKTTKGNSSIMNDLF